MAAARRPRTYGWLLAIGYGDTFVHGLLVVNEPEVSILNITGADNVLHIVSALTGARDRTVAEATQRRHRRTALTVRVLGQVVAAARSGA